MEERINNILKNKINYISGTICPADKDKENNELESLKKAFDYFVDLHNNNIVDDIVVQPKYMGSRLQFYFDVNNVDDCYCVTRNGYKTKLDEYKNDIYNLLKNKLADLIEKFKIKFMIIDGEILPWKLLGKNLIDSEFSTVYYGAKSELEILKDAGYDDKFNNLINKYKESDFEKEYKEDAKESLSKKYTRPVYETFKMIKNNKLRYLSIDEQLKSIDVFGKQLKLYGADSKIVYKPFAILKIITEDSLEYIPGIKYESGYNLSKESEYDLGNVEMSKLLIEEDFLVLNLKNDMNDNFKKLEKYWKTIIDNNHEGIVIKPDFINPDYAPSIKVRNPAYLHIIYGYDYLSQFRLKQLIGKKKIIKKLDRSIKEFKLGLRMLKIKYDDIDKNNDEYKKILTNFISSEVNDIDIAL